MFELNLNYLISGIIIFYVSFLSWGCLDVFLYKNTFKQLQPVILKEDCSGKTILSVSKKVSKFWDKNGINVYSNEKKWLNILKDSNIIAKPIHFDDIHRIITTEYSGERINKYNLPDDWEKQRDFILFTLKKYNCRHNDIKPEEILVYNDKIKLIDFGWAHEFNEKNPDYWPSELGAGFKCNKTTFDDKCSFNKSINYIINS